MYFNGDEKFSPGHYCKRVFAIEAIAYDSMINHEEGSDSESEMEEATREDDLLKLSLQDYIGEFTPETMKLQEVLHQQVIQIFMDSGSMDNFLEATLATKLNIQQTIPNKWMSLLPMEKSRGEKAVVEPFVTIRGV